MTRTTDDDPRTIAIVAAVAEYRPWFEQAGLRARFAASPEELDQLTRTHGADVEAVVTRGEIPFTATHMARLPRLRIVSALGAGTETIDLAEAARRGVRVTSNTGLNAAVVGEHAMALLLACVRQIAHADALVRAGGWPRLAPPVLHGRRMGILGLGAVGSQIAQRAAAFGMSVGYHSRHEVPDAGHLRFPSVLELAEWADVLAVCLPGGRATEHAVDGDVLDALGESGYLVNVARGSVVDTEALIDRLRTGRLAGAALDVFEGEPVLDPRLRDLPMLVVTSHYAGRAPEVMRAAVEASAAIVRAELGAG